MKNLLETVCMPMTEKIINPVGMYRISLPQGVDAEEMTKQFKNAPQFGQVDLSKGLQMQDGLLRVILVGEDTYSKRQCAMYFTTLAEQLKKSETATPELDRWTPLEYQEPVEEEGSSDMENSLAILPDVLVDPKCQKEASEIVGFPLDELKVKGLMVEGKENHQMTYWAATAGMHVYSQEDAPHLFISVGEGQLNSELSKDLQLNYGFTLCHIGSPTDAYLEEVFWTQAEKYYPNIRENTSVDGKAVVKHLKHLRGKDFSQKDVESCVKRTFPLELLESDISTEHFSFVPSPLVKSVSGRSQLASMVELEDVKKLVQRLLAMDQLQMIRAEKGLSLEPRHRHMAFEGAPGTGKTVTAQVLAKILHEEGVGSGIFVEAGKEDLVGRFLGHTAPKVAKLFEQARGGVLFLDEIGALAPKNTGGMDHYTEEAINALVYHMDRNPETVVIFATYPDEMEEFLDTNPGLSSRVAQRIHFPSYSKGSLLEIFQSICDKEGYTVEKKALTSCGSYLQKEKELSPRTFGNGREVRRIFNAVEEELAVRLSTDPDGKFCFNYKDMKTAIARLESKNKQEKRVIGFAM